MDRNPDQKRAVQFLYPPIDPYDQRMLDVGEGHQIYVEQCGNPEGAPVVVLHGGTLWEIGSRCWSALALLVMR